MDYSAWLISHSSVHAHNSQPTATGTIYCVDTAGALRYLKMCPYKPNGTWHSAETNAPASIRPSVRSTSSIRTFRVRFRRLFRRTTEWRRLPTTMTNRQ